MWRVICVEYLFKCEPDYACDKRDVWHLHVKTWLSPSRSKYGWRFQQFEISQTSQVCQQSCCSQPSWVMDVRSSSWKKARRVQRWPKCLEPSTTLLHIRWWRLWDVLPSTVLVVYNPLLHRFLWWMNGSPTATTRRCIKIYLYDKNHERSLWMSFEEPPVCTAGGDDAPDVGGSRDWANSAPGLQGWQEEDRRQNLILASFLSKKY